MRKLRKYFCSFVGVTVCDLFVFDEETINPVQFQSTIVGGWIHSMLSNSDPGSSVIQCYSIV